jgi:hypothetical protein
MPFGNSHVLEATANAEMKLQGNWRFESGSSLGLSFFRLERFIASSSLDY